MEKQEQLYVRDDGRCYLLRFENQRPIIEDGFYLREKEDLAREELAEFARRLLLDVYQYR